MYLFASYIVFLLLSIYITVYVGWLCYRNGYLYVLELFHHQEAIAKSINQLLLIAYYLINIGYILYALNCWGEIKNLYDTMKIIVNKLSIVLLSLAYLHYQNIFVIYIMRKYSNHKYLKFLTP